MADFDLPPAGLTAMSADAWANQAGQAGRAPQAGHLDVSLALHEDGEGAQALNSPHVVLAGFNGSLDALLDLARAERIDLARLSFADLLDQLLAALERPGPLLAKASWVVVMASLVQLRSRLLLPADNPERRQAAEEAGRLRDRLAELQGVRALAAWLAARPQLGRDVFGRGAPEWLGVTVEAPGMFDAIEFLWAAVGVFDDDVVETQTVYQPRVLELYSVSDAQQRIRRLLSAMPDGCGLGQLLPAQSDDAPVSVPRRRSAWTSTFSAALELAKLGEAVLDQPEAFGALHARHPEADVPTTQVAT